MNIRPVQNGETLAIAGLDELHAANWKGVVSDITRLFDAHNTRHIELDLSEVRVIDNYGVGLLIALDRLAQHRAGKLRVRNPSQSVRSILELTRMLCLIAIEIPDAERASSTVSPTRSYLAP